MNKAYVLKSVLCKWTAHCSCLCSTCDRLRAVSHFSSIQWSTCDLRMEWLHDLCSVSGKLLLRGTTIFPRGSEERRMTACGLHLWWLVNFFTLCLEFINFGIQTCFHLPCNIVATFYFQSKPIILKLNFVHGYCDYFTKQLKQGMLNYNVFGLSFALYWS